MEGIQVENLSLGDELPTVSGTSPSAPAPAESTLVCRYFMRGTCRFGPRCRYSHDLELLNDDNANISPTPAVGNSIGVNLTTSPVISKIPNWADAPVFVPGRMNIAQAVDAGEDDDTDPGSSQKTWAEVVGIGLPQVGAMLCGTPAAPGSVELVCPYESPCPFSEYCAYSMHFELCPMCDQYCLHPKNQEQQRQHKKECLHQHEQAMELSFAIARSKDKTCGICFDTIMEKTGKEKRFGILPNCNHIFCLECIRKWRQAKQFEHKISRSCPECRVCSDFVCPSAFWVETKEEKDNLLGSYRTALGIKDCKYFKKGEGKCPFGNKCFYKHALPNGDIVDVGNPKRARKMMRSSNEIIDLLDVYLWDFVDQRDYHWLEMLSSASDDSDESDYDSEE